MRIADLYKDLSADANAAASLRGKPGAADTSGPQSGRVAQQGAVKVTVSAKALEMASANSSSGIDQAKVAKLRDAVESGSLTMDSTKIAQRIVDGD